MLLRLLIAVTLLVSLLFTAWASAAIWFDGPASRPLAGGLAAGYALCTLLLLVRLRPWPRAFAAAAVLGGAVLAWWLSIEPSNERDWLEDVSRLASATVDGSKLTIENVRHFDYRSASDYTPRWETRTYDLSKLRGMDIYISYWGPRAIAHTIATWDFEDGQSLAISIETRKEAGETYSAVRGFFRQFELYYVVADERDVIRLRTEYRGEQVHLYRLRGEPDHARRVLLDYVDSINRLAQEPTWYNAFEHNCTTSIAHHIQHVIPGKQFDWRLLLNGYVDSAAYDHGTIDTSMPFEEVRARALINDSARSAGTSPEFSQMIRADIPPRPVPRP